MFCVAGIQYIVADVVLTAREVVGGRKQDGLCTGTVTLYIIFDRLDIPYIGPVSMDGGRVPDKGDDSFILPRSRNTV